MRVLFDTCIVVDVLQHREPFWEDSYNAFLAVANRQAEGFLSAKSLTDIYYLTHRKTHDRIETHRIISKLLVVFDLLDTMASDCRKALLTEAGDYEDAIMIETAVRSEMDCIITRNLRDYRASPLPVYTPPVFLELLP